MVALPLSSPSCDATTQLWRYKGMKTTLILLLKGRVGQVLPLLILFCQRHGDKTIKELMEETNEQVG